MYMLDYDQELSYNLLNWRRGINEQRTIWGSKRGVELGGGEGAMSAMERFDGLTGELKGRRDDNEQGNGGV